MTAPGNAPRPTPRPLDSPEEARQLDRYYMLGLACMFALIIAFPVYLMGEPSRRERTKEAMREENVVIGEAMFKQHCMACHGDDARGGRGFPTLGAKEFLTSVSDKQLHWLISGGVPGSQMTAYDLDLGGPFTSQEISRLVAYLRSLEDGAPSVPGWFKGPRAPEREKRRAEGARDAGARNEGAGAERRGDDDRKGDDRGGDDRGGDDRRETAMAPAQRFATQCASCHGANGEGTVIGKPIRPLRAALVANPDSAFRIVSRGVAGTAMMPFAREHGGTLDSTTIRALLVWLRNGEPAASR